ncbi:MAG: class I tRNA ligase family protein [Candidatus Peribacteria bacterium]|nr:MAG: class I tRNA ligase family protein [Candidatus Peribacteria bacterium]
MDALFTTHNVREVYLAYATELGVSGAIVVVRSREELIQQRLQTRKDDHSDATFQTYQEKVVNWEDPLGNFVEIDNSGSLDDLGHNIQRAIAQELSTTTELASEYVTTDDGFIDVVSGVVKDAQGRYLMLHHKISGNWECPGGKIHTGEFPADALKRELQEELGITVTHEKLLGFCKIIYCGKPYRFHYFSVDYTGEPSVQEAEKHHEIKWVELQEFDNDLGYVLKVDDIVIDDIAQLKKQYISIYLTQKVIAHTSTDNVPMSFLAWTTTPWTLPANMFLAVNPELWYKILFDPAEKEYFILAENRIDSLYKSASDYLEVYRLKGSELLGIQYQPLFDYYYKSPHILPGYHSQVHRVLAADFVTDDSGTGIAHEAPAFGEDDYNLVASVLPRDTPKERLFAPVNDHGEFTAEVPDWAGENVIASNKPIIQRLKEDGRLVKLETINHSYPHCPRTGEPLIYKAIESWFVKEQELTANTVPSAQDIHFVPETVKTRFINGLQSAPDWNISRTRFW